MGNSLSVRAIAGEPEERADELLRDFGPSKPPVDDLESLARHRGVTRIQVDAKIFADGLTLRETEGFAIVLRPASAARYRFTFAHEIGHTHFYRPNETGVWKHASAGAAEEGWCHNFAGALLMPAAWLRQDVRDLSEPSLTALDGLIRRYRVSVEALTWRLAHLQIWPTLILRGERSAEGWVVKTLAKSRHLPGVSTGLRTGALHPGASLLERAASTPARHAAAKIEWPVAFRPRGRIFLQTEFWAEARVQILRDGTMLSTMLVHLMPSAATQDRLQNPR